MATFVLMTKLSPELTSKMEKRDELGRAWIERVREKCPEVKFIAHYALFGPYDFMDIYEAPDEESAAKVSMISMSHGALSAESWLLIAHIRLVTRRLARG